MFCPRCGARNEPDAAFCEHCGAQLGPMEAAALPSGDERPGPGRRPALAGGVVVVLATVALVLFLTGAFSRDDVQSHDTARTATAVTLPTTAPTATVEPDTSTETSPTDTVAEPSPLRPRSVPATVSRTCGRGGVGGDCHLSVRARPASGAPELRRLDEGDSLRLSCQVRGEAVHSSALGADSTVWSRTAVGGYVSNAYVTGPQLKAQAMTLRRC